MKRLVLAAVLILAPAAADLFWLLGDGSSRTLHLGWALTVVTLFVLVVLGLLELIASRNSNEARRRVGFLEVLLGADGRPSTGKTVVGLWTLIFAASLMMLSALVWFGDLTAKDAFGGNWDAYFLLLGGPFAAAVLAKGITVRNLGVSADAKSSTDARSGTALPTAVKGSGTPSAADLLSNDTGDGDLVDTQYFVFSLVAIFYFVGALVQHLVMYANSSAAFIGLPDIPSALLGLTSLASLTYVGNKAVQNQGLRAVSMDPNPVVHGDTVTVTLVNLPDTATQANTWVVIGDSTGTATPKAPHPFSQSAPKEVSFQAPATPGDYQVTIVAPDTVAGPLQLKVT